VRIDGDLAAIWLFDLDELPTGDSALKSLLELINRCLN